MNKQRYSIFVLLMVFGLLPLLNSFNNRRLCRVFLCLLVMLGCQKANGGASPQTNSIQTQSGIA